MSGPLDGIRIIEVGHMLAGPYCGLVLADLGAKVIKIEPPEGDIARNISPHRIGEHNAYFASLNRSKKSIVLDLASEGGQSALRHIAAEAHALVTNLRPSAIKKLGLTYDALKGSNERLVCVALTGYGLEGPHANRPAYDYVIQAMTGIMSLTGDPAAPPTKAGYSAVDNSAGLVAALGLVAKIVQGKGGQVDVAMYDVMLSQLNYLAGAWLNAGESPERFAYSSHPYIVPAQIFPTADGWLTLFITHDQFWQKFCRELGKDEWITDPVFATMASRRQNRQYVLAEITEALATDSACNWVKRLEHLGVVVAEIGTLNAALSSDLAVDRNLVVQLGDSELALRGVGSPIKFSDSSPEYGPPPLLDQHRAEIIRFVEHPWRCAPSRQAGASPPSGGRSEGMSAIARPPLDRRALGLALTRLANTGTAEALGKGSDAEPATRARRIGLTGAPGAGKSTLAGKLAVHRATGRRLGVLAIDPTSPKSGGAILGDRIRMDDLAGSEDVYIRSFASRSASDGLTDNLPELLEAMDAFGFDEVILETVGVGQAEQAARTQVDTLVLVLPPDAGDAVQAMKAGIMEIADIYVVNKADLPAAMKMASEVKRIVALTHRGGEGWIPPVVLTSESNPDSVDKLSQQIDNHFEWLRGSGHDASRRLERKKYRLRRVLERQIQQCINAQSASYFERSAREQITGVIANLSQVLRD